MSSPTDRSISDNTNDRSPFAKGISDHDLQAYLDKVGYRDKPSPTLACLSKLHFLHPTVIPFENINPFFGIPVLLGSSALVEKMVYQQRGGFCFEHNLLFGAVLRSLGFRVKSLAARVLWQLTPGTIMPRDHMVLLVEVEGTQYLVDVGWGGNTVTSPLRLHSKTTQQTSHEPIRLKVKNGLHLLSMQINEAWLPMHEFGMEEYFLPDYEVISWYLCHHPESIFISHLMAARTIPSGRIALKNNQLSEYNLRGEATKKFLHTRDELIDVLETRFLIKVPEAVCTHSKLDVILSSQNK